MSTIPQYDALQKRVNALRLQKARYGISSDPHIDIELRDSETLLQQMHLIDLHRYNVEQLLDQKTHFGAHVPTHVVTSLADERREIARLRQVCANLGQGVPKHPLDSDEPQQVHVPVPQDSATSDILTKLDMIEQLVKEIRASLN